MKKYRFLQDFFDMKKDDAQSIRKELGDECLMLVFGGE